MARRSSDPYLHVPEGFSELDVVRLKDKGWVGTVLQVSESPLGSVYYVEYANEDGVTFCCQWQELDEIEPYAIPSPGLDGHGLEGGSGQPAMTAIAGPLPGRELRDGRKTTHTCDRCGSTFSRRSMWQNPGSRKWYCHNWTACEKRRVARG